MPEPERDMRDLSRAYLDSRSLDEYYRTMYPRPESGKSPWRPVSNLSRDDIRKALLAYHLARKWNINGPASMTDDYLALVVSKDAFGRTQATQAMLGDAKRKRSIWERIWPFGHKDGDSQ